MQISVYNARLINRVSRVFSQQTMGAFREHKLTASESCIAEMSKGSVHFVKLDARQGTQCEKLRGGKKLCQ